MHIDNWKVMIQRKRYLIGNNYKQESHTQLYYGYRVGDNVLLRNKQAFKYYSPYKVPYKIVQMCTNGKVML